MSVCNKIISDFHYIELNICLFVKTELNIKDYNQSFGRIYFYFLNDKFLTLIFIKYVLIKCFEIPSFVNDNNKFKYHYCRQF